MGVFFQTFALYPIKVIQNHYFNVIKNKKYIFHFCVLVYVYLLRLGHGRRSLSLRATALIARIKNTPGWPALLSTIRKYWSDWRYFKPSIRSNTNFYTTVPVFKLRLGEIDRHVTWTCQRQYITALITIIVSRHKYSTLEYEKSITVQNCSERFYSVRI